MAVLTLTIMLKIDGCTTFRAAYLPDLRPDLLQLCRRKSAYELLLAQELEERRETAISGATAKIRKAPGFCQIKAQGERLRTPWAVKTRRNRMTRSIGMSLNFTKQIDYGTRGQLDAFQVVEPDSSTFEAQIDLHHAAVVAFESLGLHWLPAIGAGCQGTGCGIGHC